MARIYILGIGMVITLIVYLVRVIKVFLEKRAPLMSPAQITIVRRESSGLNSFSVWEAYLNGVNIGSIKDGASISVAIGKRYNVLTARSAKGEQSPPYNIIVGSGWDSEVLFNEGRFGNEHRTGMLADGSELPAVQNVQPLTGCAQITVARLEQSGLKSFVARYIYLNGVNIGGIKNGGSKTAVVSERYNVLTAEDINGAVTPYFSFSVKSGWHTEVRFEGGRFGGAHKIGKMSLARHESAAVQETLH